MGERAAQNRGSISSWGASEHAKLVATLNSRRSVELRKADLLTLCRLWGLRSDIWRARRKQQHPLPPPPQPSALLLAIPSALVAAPSTRMSSPAEARSLAQFGAQAFGDVTSTEELRLLHTASPPHALPGMVEALRRKLTSCRLARDATVRVSEALRGHHAAVRAELGTLSAQAGGEPAWLTLGGNEPALEPVLKVLQGLCQCAVGPFRCSPAPTASSLEDARPAQPTGEQAQLAAAGAAGDGQAITATPPSTPSQERGFDPYIRLGGQRGLHLLTHINSTLSQAKLVTFARFLDATANASSLLIEFTSAVAAGFDRHAAALEEELGQYPFVR